MADQYLRRVRLTVTAGSTGLDLSNLHIRFNVRQWDYSTPNNATIRVYNLADQTADAIEKEFTGVTLEAGYENGNFGTIFSGTIIQVRRGKEDPTSKYLDIIAGDGDEAQLAAIVNSAVNAGSTFKDRIAILAKTMEPYGVTLGYIADMPPDALPRGRVLYGSTADHLDRIAQATNTRWSIQNGELQFVSIDGYLPGEAVVLSAATGLVGFPEQTADGIRAKCLLNPKIKVGSQVQIDNKSVQQATLNLTRQGGQQNALLPSVAADGLYRTIVVEYEGDTRGTPWYSDLTLIALGAKLPPSQYQRGRW